jgi:hypothetical protein
MSLYYLIKLPETINAYILPQIYFLHNADILQDVSHILDLRVGHSGVYIPARAKNFSLLWSVQNGTSAPPVCLHGMDIETSYVYLFNDILSFYDYTESVINWINKCKGSVECCWQRKSEVYLLGDKPISLPLCPSQVPHGLACDRTPASAVRMKRLRWLFNCFYVVYSVHYDEVKKLCNTNKCTSIALCTFTSN